MITNFLKAYKPSFRKNGNQLPGNPNLLATCGPHGMILPQLVNTRFQKAPSCRLVASTRKLRPCSNQGFLPRGSGLFVRIGRLVRAPDYSKSHNMRCGPIYTQAPSCQSPCSVYLKAPVPTNIQLHANSHASVLWTYTAANRCVGRLCCSTHVRVNTNVDSVAYLENPMSIAERLPVIQ